MQNFHIAVEFWLILSKESGVVLVGFFLLPLNSLNNMSVSRIKRINAKDNQKQR